MQPLPVHSKKALRPASDPKSDRQQYYMLAHGSHLVDTARFLGGEIRAVRARLNESFGAHCWFIDVAFANGSLGHLDLTVAVRMDWHEGFHAYGEHGAITAKTFNPWCFRTSEVDIFDERLGETRRVLGADGHFYRRQVEGFARAILDGTPIEGADIADGEASVRAMVAIRQSVQSGTWCSLAEMTGGV